MSNFRTDDKYKKSAPGSAQDNFQVAGHLTNLDNEENHATTFEDTYDGLGDQLEESGDNFNDDTFGGSEENLADLKPVGRDYDFFGQTARVSQAISQDQTQFIGKDLKSKIESPSSHSQFLSKPVRSSYKRSSQPENVPEMLVDASIWGIPPKRTTPTPASGTPVVPSFAPDKRRMMSVEEIEASMLDRFKNSTQHYNTNQKICRDPLQRSQSTAPEYNLLHHPFQAEENFYGARRQMSLQGQVNKSKFDQLSQISYQGHQEIGLASNNSTSPKMFILQNPDRSMHEQKTHLIHQNSTFFRYPSGPRQIAHQYHLASLSDEEKVALRMAEVRREKRNRKIFLLSKGNGLMTPQDKNFINRIQLQQLVTATGNPNDHESDLNFTEDFYYQVHYQIHGGSCEVTGNNYLIQSGERYRGSRKPIRGFSSHLQQMEQQVQRAVEVSKLKFKNKQAVAEGTLGKMSYSSAKTPKPTLNIRCSENRMDGRITGATRDRASVQSSLNRSDRKTVLADIERVYSTLMLLEDHDRKMPRLDSDNDNSNDFAKLQDAWQEKAQEMNSHLWRQLKVHEPIGATSIHPFIAFLSYGKGMKTVPRVFRHISHEQRTTILTMIILHLDQLDLVRQGTFPSIETQLGAETREKIELFSLSVMPPLFGHLNEAGLEIVTGVLGLLLTINIDLIARTKIGITIITMILSRAELIKQAGTANDKQDWDQWISIYNSFFDNLERTLPDIFPGSIDTDEDIYVWQFLAAIGIGASPMQQQRLVVAVKDRVMETVSYAKGLPPKLSNQRLANVNLFMRSIGLDVELLD
ncbi:DNA topoisomerase 2-associated protein pat1 [Erysiphe neolycopersici]|uniref:DNA topoisomerase 2-associated protein pat1 n=1 Tax=Erysiphe neolycopersici TaxID=212602 RepID=A0A420HQN8_9PEZI|nr:DNA topoisomerase 2-associated protein pat1 [Erysiphe neolycopersici]